MDTISDILLIIDADEYDKSSLVALLEATLRHSDYTHCNIDILPFVDPYDEELTTQIKEISNCPAIKTLTAASYINRVKDIARADINSFIACLRNQMTALASEVAGKQWSKRFSELWWYSFLSEKNSPSGAAWWNLFHLEVVRLVLKEHPYRKCILVGSNNLIDLVRQLCKKTGTDFQYRILEHQKHFILKNVILRCLGLLSSILIVFFSGLAYRRRVYNRSTPNSSAEKILLYSYYPRAWTKRFDRWQDMYWGETFKALSSFPELEPTYILFLLDRNNLSYFNNFVNRIRRLSHKAAQPMNFMVLESYGNPLNALIEYLNIKDLIFYWMMARSDAFKKLFSFKDISLYENFSRQMWRSVIVWWPAILLLRRCAEAANRSIKPALTLLPYFEYIEGRAIIRGSRSGGSGKIIGFQHGPITSMKMTYAGMPEELEKTDNDKLPLPAADLYSVDGQLAKELLVQRGIREECIKTVGPPRYDGLWKFAEASASKQRFQKNRVSVLVSAGLHDVELMVRFVLAALHNDSRLDITIRLHPKYNSYSYAVDRIISSYAGGNRNQDAGITISRKGDVYSSMSEADMLLTTYSAVGVEAVAFGLPVILLCLNRLPAMSPLSYDGSPVLCAFNPETLRKHVDRIISDKEFRENYQRKLWDVVHKNFGELDGQASARLAQMCANQVEA
jgi:surface carbohydrate biosynthesis protein (TIGR04326 family)